MPSPWTIERVVELKRLHSEGYSSGLIASIMGLESRKMVLGKLQRLRLKPASPEPNPKSVKQTKQGKSRRQKSQGLHDALPSKPFKLSTVVEESPFAVPLFDLSPAVCHWPLWADDGSGERLYCGAAGEAGSRYCREHLLRSIPASMRPSVQVSA